MESTTTSMTKGHQALLCLCGHTVVWHRGEYADCMGELCPCAMFVEAVPTEKGGEAEPWCLCRHFESDHYDYQQPTHSTEKFCLRCDCDMYVQMGINAEGKNDYFCQRCQHLSSIHADTSPFLCAQCGDCTGYETPFADSRAQQYKHNTLDSTVDSSPTGQHPASSVTSGQLTHQQYASYPYGQEWGGSTISGLCKHDRVEIRVGRGRVWCTGWRAADRILTRERKPDVGFYLSEIWLTGLGRVASSGMESFISPVWPFTIVDWPDFGTITDTYFGAMVNNVAALLEEGKTVEIACQGGHGRTGTLLAALFVANGMEPEAAVRHVRKVYCREAIETIAQLGMVFVVGGKAADDPAIKKLGGSKVVTATKWTGDPVWKSDDPRKWIQSYDTDICRNCPHQRIRHKPKDTNKTLSIQCRVPKCKCRKFEYGRIATKEDLDASEGGE